MVARWMIGLIGGWMDEPTQVDEDMDRQMNQHVNRQMGRQTNRQMD